MKQRTRDIIKVCLGILLAAAGFLLLRRPSEAQGILAGLPFVSAWAVASLAMVQEICSVCAP